MERPELENEIGRDVQILGGPKGFLAYYGPHKTKQGYRAGVVCDEVGQGKNNGIVGGRRYFTCKNQQGLLVDPRKIKLLSGDADRKLVWVKRANYCKKLDAAFVKLVRHRLGQKQSAMGVGSSLQVWRKPAEREGEVGKLMVKEPQPEAKDDGLQNRPLLKKGVSVKKMEVVLKKSRKSVKQGGHNKYNSEVTSRKERRLSQVEDTIKEASPRKGEEYEHDLLEKTEAAQKEMQERSKRRASEVLDIKEAASAMEELEREEKAKLEADKEAERLTKEEEEALQAALEAEAAQAEKEKEEIEKVHADLEARVGVSQLSLKSVPQKKSFAHPMLEQIDSFLTNDGFAVDE